MTDDGLHTIELGIYGAQTIITYETESEAIFAAFTTPPDATRKGLIDDVVVALKAAGVWIKIDALHVLAAADSQAALVNWKAPGTYNGTLINAPTFTADRGFDGASTKYIDTNFNATTASSPNYTLNSATLFGWSLTDTNTTNVGFIGYPSFTASQMVPKAASSLGVYQINATGSATIAVSDGLGLWAASRSAAALTTCYKNGASFNTRTTGTTALINENLNYLRRTTGYFNGRMAVGGIGGSLTDADHTALYNALNTYLASVGAV